MRHFDAKGSFRFASFDAKGSFRFASFDAKGSFNFASLFQEEDRGSEQRRAQTAVERCSECYRHADDLKCHAQAHHENHNHPSAHRKSL